MKISFKLIEKYVYSDEALALLIISFLHYNGFINDDKLKSLFSQLRSVDENGNNKLLRNVVTHKSTINNRWYNCERMIDILFDTLSFFTFTKKEMELDTFLMYTNKLLNMNKNFCLDHIYFEIVEKVINDYVGNFTRYDGHNFIKIQTFGLDIDFKAYSKVFEVNTRGIGSCYEEETPNDIICATINHIFSTGLFSRESLILDFKKEIVKYKSKDWERFKDRKFKL